MSERTTTHRPLSQDDWKFIFDVIYGTKLDVPRIRAEVARLAAAESRANELNAMLEHRADEAAEMERMLRAEYANAESRAEETRRLYDELLYQVSMKHLGESRHQTALRYLRQSESNVCWPDSAALTEGEAG